MIHLFDFIVTDFNLLGNFIHVLSSVTEFINTGLWDANFERQSCTKCMAIYLVLLSDSPNLPVD